jgi:NAD+ kinase
VKRVGLVAKPDAVEAQRVVLTLLDWLGARGLTVVLEKETAALAPGASVASASKSDLPAQVDAVIVLGGDGTLLSMAPAHGDHGVPSLGAASASSPRPRSTSCCRPWRRCWPAPWRSRSG